MDEGRSELGWFRAELGRALLHPRDFARSLRREHYGLSGLVVALAAGVLLSVSVDTLALASRGFDPFPFLTRLVIDALFLAVRLAVTAAIAAAAAAGALRLLRRADPAMDQLFTALTYGLVPLAAALPLVMLIALAPETAPVLGVGLALVALRVVAGLALNLHALLGPALAALTLAIAAGVGSVALGDQLARIRSVAYTFVPALAPPLEAPALAGVRHDGDTYALTLPAHWENATTGVRGEAARFMSAAGYLIVKRVRGDPLLTAEEFAERVATEETRYIDRTSNARGFVRTPAHVLVDQRMRGTNEGRPVLMRQFTAVNGGQVMSLVFHFVQPEDEAALLRETAAIAASWRVGRD